MKRVVVADTLVVGQTFKITGRDRHYLIDVLRKSVGDTLEVLDASGTVFGANIDRLEPEYVRLHATNVRESRPAGPRITLFQALPKGRKFDEIVRTAVQAGVTRFVPLISERTIVRTGPGADRLDRWTRVAREAVQQSGAPVPEFLPVADLPSLHTHSEVSLFLHTEPLAQSTLHSYLVRCPASIDLVVGPEGGFSDAEVDLLEKRGFGPVYLGPRVLRTENAALFALGAIQILLLEHETWNKEHAT